MNENEIVRKAGRIEGGRADSAELALINAQTLRPLAADEVFAFRICACDDQVDRDFERFTETALTQLADLYVGKTMLIDHLWSATAQTARVYGASVEVENGTRRLMLRAYLLRTPDSAPTIAAIEAGILREVSVACAVRRRVCSICGAAEPETYCEHVPGRTYGDQVCHRDLEDIADAYEVSFVAVPAQRGAGVVKDAAASRTDEKERFLQALRLLRLEEKRYGGLKA